MDPLPSRQNALCRKLPLQVDNKVKPHPFQTRQPKGFYRFHNHRQAPERICKSKFQEKERVAFPIPLLSRRCFSCLYKYHLLIGKISLFLSFKEEWQPNEKLWTRKSFLQTQCWTTGRKTVHQPPQWLVRAVCAPLTFLCAAFLSTYNPSMRLFSECSIEVTHRLESWPAKSYVWPLPSRGLWVIS